jgi:hypothetical protein
MRRTIQRHHDRIDRTLHQPAQPIALNHQRADRRMKLLAINDGRHPDLRFNRS